MLKPFCLLTCLAYVQALEHRAAVVRTKGVEVIVRHTFNSWVVSERGQLLRSVHDGRAVKYCLNRWRNLHHSHTDLEGQFNRAGLELEYR
jgi:hypothetical protein